VRPRRFRWCLGDTQRRSIVHGKLADSAATRQQSRNTFTDVRKQNTSVASSHNNTFAEIVEPGTIAVDTTPLKLLWLLSAHDQQTLGPQTFPMSTGPSGLMTTIEHSVGATNSRNCTPKYNNVMKYRKHDDLSVFSSALYYIYKFLRERAYINKLIVVYRLYVVVVIIVLNSKFRPFGIIFPDETCKEQQYLNKWLRCVKQYSLGAVTTFTDY